MLAIKEAVIFEFPPADSQVQEQHSARNRLVAPVSPPMSVSYYFRSLPLPLSYTWSSWQFAVGLAAGDKDNMPLMLAAAKMKWPLAGCHVSPSRIGSLDQMQHYLIRRSAVSDDVVRAPEDFSCLDLGATMFKLVSQFQQPLSWAG